MKHLNMILAADERNAIGRKGGIPWHIPADFKYFKNVTMGHAVIMGWATWVSLNCKPLPGRTNIVLCPDPQPDTGPGVKFCTSLESALEAAGDDAFIIGGGYTYRQALPLATRIYLTRVHTVVEDADTFFPQLDGGWTLVSASELHKDEASGVTFEFLVYERI